MSNVEDALNHKQISDAAYNTFGDFNKIMKTSKKISKVFAAVDIAIDAYDIASTIYYDLNDEDEKLGKETVSKTAEIGGGWAGGAAGGKLGAMGGAAIGTAILPGLGTIIGGALGGIGGGIVGAYGGSELFEYLVDKYYKGD